MEEGEDCCPQCKAERENVAEDSTAETDPDTDESWKDYVDVDDEGEDVKLDESDEISLAELEESEKEYDDDGNVVWTRLYDRYDTAEYYDFDEAWHTIMDELWMCSSFADMIETEDGKKTYSPTSLLGMVKEKIDVNPFYKGLFEKLKDLNDSTLTSDNFLKSELFGTINGYKQLI